MKTSRYYKLLASIVLVSTFTFSATNLFAQRRAYNEEATRYEERRRNKPLHDYNKRDRYQKNTKTHREDRDSYRRDDRSNQKKSYHRDHDHYTHKKHKKHKQHKYHKHHKHHNHKHRDQGHVEYRYYHGDHYRSNHRHHHRHHYPYYRYKHYYNKHGHSCYNHSKYGEVIWRFACEPRVIHHHDGDYYYSDGCYYRYYPEFGFVHVDAPRSVYFSHLPNDCHRVRIHGEVYYTDGDLCFVRHRKGFRLVKAPSGIHISFKF